MSWRADLDEGACARLAPLRVYGRHDKALAAGHSHWADRVAQRASKVERRVGEVPGGLAIRVQIHAKGVDGAWPAGQCQRLLRRLPLHPLCRDDGDPQRNDTD